MRLCVPSQNGALAECLQPQKKTVLFSVASYFLGETSLPVFEPSHKG